MGETIEQQREGVNMQNQYDIKCGDYVVCAKDSNQIMTVVANPSTYKDVHIVMCKYQLPKKRGRRTRLYQSFDVNALTKVKVSQ